LPHYQAFDDRISKNYKPKYKNMVKYRISGVWKNPEGIITHYAFHTVQENGTSWATKKTKSEAIRILETSGHSATTWLWDYSNSNWRVGENVEVVSSNNGKYLRSDRNSTKSDNLGHLIDFDWIAP
jgi:hypothetical protein